MVRAVTEKPQKMIVNNLKHILPFIHLNRNVMFCLGGLWRVRAQRVRTRA